MGAIAALHSQVVGAELESFGREQLIGAGVRDLDPLEFEEEELCLDGGTALAHLLDESSVRRILGVGGESKVREVRRPPGEVMDLGQSGHRLHQAGAVELLDMALIGAGKALGTLVGAVEKGIDRSLGAVRPGVDAVK